MSRARVHEVSSPISLFPFIGILLCTMGALLVVLVAVSRSARNTAEREVQTKQQQSQPQNDAQKKKLAEVNAYVGHLETMHNLGERRLHEEEARLSHVEDSIRRLHEKMDSLQAAAAALQSMEREHYDDRQQAEREVKRLHQLIDDSQKSVAALREQASKAAHSYAVVPYEGPNGTYRRPIYIECVKSGLILQPEGVRLTINDLRPPLGPGNPLATVLRASRDQIIRMHPGAGKSRDTTPYPLLLVRPDGLYAYDHAREAIQAGDFDLGFELVESDWKLKFPPPDPQLAEVEQQALVQARARQVLLAAAAPRAYRNAAVADDEDYGDGDYGGDGGDGLGDVSAGNGGTGGGRYGSGSRTYVVRNNQHTNGGGSGGGGDGSEPSGGGSGASGMSGSGSGSGPRGGAGGGAGNVGPADDGRSTPWAPRGSSGSAQSGGNSGGGDIDGGTSAHGSGGTAGSGAGSSNGAPGGAGSFGGGAAGGTSGGSGMPGGPPVDKNLVPDGYQSPAGGSVTVGTSPQGGFGQSPESQRERERMRRFESRGKDWALRGKPPRAVPVRRTIHVTVRKDQLVITPDAVSPNDVVSGSVIPMRGDTVESIDEFVKQVRGRIDGWGIAGDGLYWRPVVLLRVEPSGQQRADDLARLLKNSGLEIRTDQIANKSPQGSDHETR